VGFVLRASANGEELNRVFDSGNRSVRTAITCAGPVSHLRAPAPAPCTTQNAIPEYIIPVMTLWSMRVTNDESPSQ